DPGFKQALLARGREAVRELNIPPGRLGKLGVAENTATLHNVVVCTLCSCYPHDLLGDPPWWYRDDSYKQRIVQDPRGTLAHRFNLRLPDSVEVRVHDSTSDVRWMVLPRRPAGTDGWSEEELARLVTIDSLVGTAEALTPAASAHDAREDDRGPPGAHPPLPRRRRGGGEPRNPPRHPAPPRLRTRKGRHRPSPARQHQQPAAPPGRVPAAVQR